MTEIVPHSSEGGNTKTPSSSQISPSVRWCFTLNNYTEDEKLQISSIVPNFCKYYIVGEEVGENGTPHLQGYIEFKTKKRPKSIFDNVRIHWEKSKGTREDNTTYCSKEKVWIGCSDYFASLPPECIEEDKLYKWQKEALKIYKGVPDKRSIHWFWGDKNIGKTEFCRFLNIKYNVPFCYGGKVSDIMNLAYNNMKGQKCFVFCLTKVKRNNISYDALEQLKDGMISNSKYETGCFCIERPHVFVFANFPPESDYDEQFMSSDKFVVKKVKKDKPNVISPLVSSADNDVDSKAFIVEW